MTGLYEESWQTLTLQQKKEKTKKKAKKQTNNQTTATTTKRKTRDFDIKAPEKMRKIKY